MAYSRKKKKFHNKKKTYLRQRITSRRKYTRKKSKKKAPYHKKKKSIYTDLTAEGHLKPIGPVTADYRPTPIENSFNFLPTNKYWRCPYVDNRDLASPTGIEVGTAFKMNGIFHPQATGGGHQALWRDQLALYYKAYQVMSSHVTVTFRWQEANDGSLVRPNMLCYAIPSDTASTLQPLVYAKQEIYPSCCRTLKPGLNDSCTIRYSYYPKKFFSMKDIQDDPTLYCAITQDPARLAYIVCGIQSMDSGAAIACPVHVHTKISYNVRCFQPKSADPSMFADDTYVTIDQESDDLGLSALSVKSVQTCNC